MGVKPLDLTGPPDLPPELVQFCEMQRPAASTQFVANTANVAVLIGSLEAVGEATDIVGEQLERHNLPNPLKNPGISFFTVAKGAGAITSLAGKKIRSILGFSTAQSALQKAAEALSTFDKVKDIGATLFKEGKLLTWLPEAGYHMRVGWTIANVVDRVVGPVVEGKFGKDARSRLHTLAFFSPEIIGDCFTGGRLNKFLARTVLGGQFGPAAEIYFGLNGLFFANSLVTGSIDYMVLGRAAYYNNFIAKEAYGERPQNPATQFLFGEDVMSHFCSGKYEGVFVDAIEGAEVFLGLKAPEYTCRFWREKVAEFHERQATEQIANIREDLRMKLAMGELDDYEKIPYEMWETAYNSGWFDRVDCLYLGGSQEDILLLQNIVSISYTWGADGMIEPVRQFFSYDLLNKEDEALKKGLMPEGPIIREGQFENLVEWVGGERLILERRRRVFYYSLIEAIVNLAIGELSTLEHDSQIIELGIKAGFVVDNQPVRTREYYVMLSKHLSAAIEQGDNVKLAKLQAYAKFNRMRFRRTGEYGYLTDLMVLHPDIIFRDDPEKREDYNELLAAQAGGLKNNGILVKTLQERSGEIQTGLEDKFTEYIFVKEMLGDDGYSDLITGVKYYADADAWGVKLPDEDGDPILDRRLVYKMQTLKAYNNFLSRPSTCSEEAKSVDSLRECYGAGVDRKVREFRGFGLDPYAKKQWYKKMEREVNELLLDIRSEVTTAWLGIISLTASEGGDTILEFRNVLNQPEHLILRQKISRAATYWKAMGRPKDEFWRTFVSGAFTPEGEIENMAALHNWISEEAPKIIEQNIKKKEEAIARKRRVLAVFEEFEDAEFLEADIRLRLIVEYAKKAEAEVGLKRARQKLFESQRMSTGEDVKELLKEIDLLEIELARASSEWERLNALLADVEKEKDDWNRIPVMVNDLWKKRLLEDIDEYNTQIEALKKEKEGVCR